jgi:hypothetical protein
MNLNSIRDWLNSSQKDYHTGVNLFFNATGKVATRDSLIKHFSMQKLLKLMEDLVSEDNEVIEKTIEVKKKENEVSDTIPKEVLEIKSKMMLLWKELSIEHAKLQNSDDEAINFEIAKKCVDIDLMLGKFQDDILHWEKYKKLPIRAKVPQTKNLSEEQARMKLTINVIPKIIYREKKYIEQFTKKMEASNDVEEIEKFKKTIAKKREKIAQKQAERLQLIKLINNIKNDN